MPRMLLKMVRAGYWTSADERYDFVHETADPRGRDDGFLWRVYDTEGQPSKPLTLQGATAWTLLRQARVALEATLDGQRPKYTAFHAGPRQIRPRLCNGIDYGTEGQILLQTKGGRLVWQGGYYTWGSVLEPKVYEPSQLMWDRNKQSDLGETITHGGRLTNKLLAAHLDTIAQHAELDKGLLAAALDVALREKKTVTL